MVVHAAPDELRLDDLQYLPIAHDRLYAERTCLVAPYVLDTVLLFAGTVHVGVRHAVVHLCANAAVAVSERLHQSVELHAARHRANE